MKKKIKNEEKNSPTKSKTKQCLKKNQNDRTILGFLAFLYLTDFNTRGSLELLQSFYFEINSLM